MIPYKTIATVFVIGTLFFRIPHEPVKINYKPNGLGTAENHIHFTSSVDNLYFLSPSATETEICLYLEMSADEFTETNKERAPLNLSLVIDRSGSMSGLSIYNVKTACDQLIRQMDKTDRLSVVIYDDVSSVLVTNTPVSDPGSIIDIINKIAVRGSTNIHAGLIDGYKETKDNYVPDAINKVILLSDGMANKGVTDPRQLAKMANEHKMNDNVSLTSFGVGKQFNEDLMTALSEAGSGNYYFIDSASKISGMMQQEFDEMMNVQGLNARFSIRLPEGISFVKSYGYTVTENHGVLNVDLGDIYPNDSKGVLIKLKINSPPQTAYHFTSTFSYDDVFDEKRRKYVTRVNSVSMTSDALALKSGVDEKVKGQMVLFTSNEMLALAMAETDKGNYNEARKMVSVNKSYMKEQLLLVKPTRELLLQDSLNTSYETKIQNAERMSIEERKAMQKYEKMNNYYMEKKRMDKNPYYMKDKKTDRMKGYK